MEEQNNQLDVLKEKEKQKAARSSSPEEYIQIQSPADVKEEIKKFKESLLQSVSSGEQIIPESAELLVTDECSRERKASTTRVPKAVVLAEIDEAKLFELKEAFLLFDLDGDGYIDNNDLRGTLISLGETVDDHAVRAMLAEATCPLDFDAFVTLLGYKTLELDTEETLIAALSRWDRDNSGLISEERIRHDLMTWGDKFTEKEADYALDDAPLVQKGGRAMIDYVRFCSQLSGLRKSQKN